MPTLFDYMREMARRSGIKVLLAVAAIALTAAARDAETAYPVTAGDREFLQQVLTAVRNRDATWLAAHTFLPVVIPDGVQRRVIRSEPELVRELSHRLDADLSARMDAATTKPLFSNWRGVMLGDGILWFTKYGTTAKGTPWRYYITSLGHFVWQENDTIVESRPDDLSPLHGVAERAVAFYSRAYTMDNDRMPVNLPADWPVRAPAFIAFSPHGNGVLHVGKFSVRIFDENADPICYRDKCLDVRFTKGEHGEPLITLTGTVQRWDNNGEAIIDEAELVVVYRFDPATDHATRIVGSVPFEADTNYLNEQL